jgi:2-amino-4-hydroxy-6-hydroxymethyldihydropteridine diphosphokinase
MVMAYIGLGANLGQPMVTLQKATEQVRALGDGRHFQVSSFFGSAPVQSSGPDYVNAVVALSTALPAYDLLSALQRIETLHGRERPYLNAPRTLDLDLLLYGDGAVHGPGLVVPHPRMYERAFVLRPLAQIAPHLVSAEQLQTVSHQDIHLLS